MKNIVVLSPNAWDDQEIENRKGKYNFISYGPDIQRKSPGLIKTFQFLLRFDIHEFIKKAVFDLKNKRVDAIVGTDEYLACAVAAILAQELNLPGACPRAVLLSQNKWYSRVLQKEILPHNVPDFFPIQFDSSFDRLEFSYPRFVKPVRGSASFLAKQVCNSDALHKHVALPKLQRFILSKLLHPYEQLLRKYADVALPLSPFVAESVIEGNQVTVEGYAAFGRVHILGIVDSIMYPGSRIAFERFEYPSKLSARIQTKISEMAQELIQHIGLHHGMFNIEFFYNSMTDSVHIIEINPRLSFQFSDLFAKVDGFNTYDIQLELALGEIPKINHKIGPHKVAASFVLRSFEDQRVARVPTGEELAEIQSIYPDARVRVMAGIGKNLSHDFLQDTESFRYGIINLGGSSRENLYLQFADVSNRLKFEFLPLSSMRETFGLKSLGRILERVTAQI